MADRNTPSPEAEQRWRTAEARFRRRIAVTALAIAGGIVLTYLAAMLSLKPLAILCFVTVVAGMILTIWLIVQRNRAFLAIMMDDGMTRREALQEGFRRHG